MAEDQKPIYKSALLRNTKLQLRAPCPTAPGKWSSLRWDMYRDNPRLVVRTNDPADQEKDYGQITAAMDPSVFYIFLDQLEQVVAGNLPSFKLECHNIPRNDTGSRDIVHISDIWVGKDKDGVMNISVVSKNDTSRPVVKFPFDVSDSRFHKLYHKSGEEYTLAERSVAAARGYLMFLKQIMPLIHIADWTPPPPNPNAGNRGGFNKGGGGFNKGGGFQRQGGGGGGFQRGGNGGGGGYGGGYNRGGAQAEPRAATADDSSDDNIPF